MSWSAGPSRGRSPSATRSASGRASFRSTRSSRRSAGSSCGAFKRLWGVPSRGLVSLVRAATGRLHRFGYVAVAFGDPVRFRDMPQSAHIAGLSDEQRRAVAKEVAAQLMDRIALVIPATPVPLVARAALDLHCEATEGELAARVHELRSRLDELSVPTALGREFDPQRAARADLQADLDRNRDLLRVESDVLA